MVDLFFKCADFTRLLGQLVLLFQEPCPFRVSFGADESTWQAGDGTLLEFGEGAGVKLSSNCRSGVCGACKVKLRSGAVAHLLDAPFPLAPDDVLTCCAVPLGDVRLEA